MFRPVPQRLMLPSVGAAAWWYVWLAPGVPTDREDGYPSLMSNKPFSRDHSAAAESSGPCPVQHPVPDTGRGLAWGGHWLVHLSTRV